MAELYYHKKDYYNAFKEYYAALMYDPFQLQYYRNTIDCLIKIHDYNLALKIIDRSLNLKETFYAIYIKGDILFLKKDFAAANLITKTILIILKFEFWKKAFVIKQ